MSLRQSSANLLRRFRISSFPKIPKNHLPAAGNTKISGQCDFEHHHTWKRRYEDAFQWIFLSGQAAIILGMNVTPALAENVSTDVSPENDTSGATTNDLRKIEDGSVVSNVHTSKWRVFTDTGRDLFLQGKLEEAEKLFRAALEEAKEGFGERDAHVASACNNLAELYRVKKKFGKAEPLYLEAITILEESFGPDDVRVGAALHNLGQFYLAQRKLEQARVCYERALKIKRRVLGEAHLDYADTMYHLGTVLYLQGKENDSEALIKDSIRKLEQAGLGESTICIKRMQYLAQIYVKSNKIAEAENIQRRILHLMELSKGWDSLDTVVAAERLARILQSAGNLREAEELLERCLAARKTLIPEDHIQNAANMLYIARVKMLKSNQLRETDISQTVTELEAAKALLGNSIRVAQQVLAQSNKQKGKQQSDAVSRRTGNDGQWAMVLLLQSYNALGLLETSRMELQELGEDHLPIVESILRQCVSAYKEFKTVNSVSDSPEVKAEYLSCLKHLYSLLSDNTNASVQQPGKDLRELHDQIKHLETEISEMRTRRG